MNQTLLAYEIELPDRGQPFEFFVPRLDNDSIAATEIVDDLLTLWLIADAKLPTQKYVGRIYAVNEPFERPKISLQFVVRRTWTIPVFQTSTAVVAANVTYTGPRVPHRTDRVVFVAEPTIEDAKSEALKHLQKELGPLGKILPADMLRTVVDEVFESKIKPKQ